MSSFLSRSLLCLALVAPAAPALDVVLSPGADLQAAIDAAAPGDRLVLLPGTYTGVIDFHGQAIEVYGLRGASQTILDGAGAAPVVRFASGEGADSRLVGVTVRGGTASSGAGGIACGAGATPTVEDCIVRNNVGKFGGGVSGSPTMRRCLILNNTASLTHGGGIYGAPTLEHCTLADNTTTSADGGGLYVPSGTAVISDTLFVRNRAIFADSSGGGAVVTGSAQASFVRCAFVGNSASGGAFAGIGGGLRANAQTTLQDCLVIDNTLTGSSLHGGGVYGPATLVNTIVRGNSGNQLEAVGAVSYCDVQGGWTGVGNLDADPLFVDQAGLDLHLTAGSPCRDAGDPALLDPDGSRSDMGAWPFAALYPRVNMTPAQLAAPSFDALSIAAGGQQELHVLAGPQHAGDLYLIAGSMTGTSPGFDIGRQHVPLVSDAWFSFTLTQANGVLLPGTLGVLDGQGRATGAFSLPPAVPGAAVLAGLDLFHAALVGTSGPAQITLVSDPVSVRLLP